MSTVNCVGEIRVLASFSKEKADVNISSVSSVRELMLEQYLPEDKFTYHLFQAFDSWQTR